MRKLFLALGIFFACAASAAAQTTVTGCITDPNGIKYSGGASQILLVGTGGQQPSVNGVPISGSMGPTSLDSNGCLQPAALYPNASITPAGTKWQFTISNPGAQPPVGFGSVIFTAPPITIAGVTQNVTAQLTAAALVLLQVGSASGSVLSINAETGAVMIESLAATIAVTTPTAHTINLEVLNSPRIDGVAVTGVPTAGQVITATSGTTATWQNGSSFTCAITAGELVYSPTGANCGGVLGSAVTAAGAVTIAPPVGGPALTVTGGSGLTDILDLNVNGGTLAVEVQGSGDVLLSPPAVGVAFTVTGAPDGSDGIDINNNFGGSGTAATINDTNGAHSPTGFFAFVTETDSTGSGAVLDGFVGIVTLAGTNVSGAVAQGGAFSATDSSSGGGALEVEGVSAGVTCAATTANCDGLRIVAPTGVPGVNNAGIEIESQGGLIAIDQSPTDPDFLGLLTAATVTDSALTPGHCVQAGAAGLLTTIAIPCLTNSTVAPPFSAITSGTNTTAAMVLGTGSSLTVSGTGTNNATAIDGVTVTGVPTVGQVPTATSGTAATWQTPTSFACSATANELLYSPSGANCAGVAGSTANAAGDVTIAPPATGVALALTMAPDSSNGLNITGAFGGFGAQVEISDTNGAVTPIAVVGISFETDSTGSGVAVNGVTGDSSVAGTNVTGDVSAGIIGSAVDASSGGAAAEIVGGQFLAQCTARTVLCYGAEIRTPIGTPGVTNAGLRIGAQSGTAISTVITDAEIFGLVTESKIFQNATKNFAGTCAMAAATSCTFSLTSAFAGTPICVVTAQGTSITGAADACSVSGTTVTITAAAVNSNTWGAVLIGNPN